LAAAISNIEEVQIETGSTALQMMVRTKSIKSVVSPATSLKVHLGPLVGFGG
jgi:hypothetical protein